MDTPTIVQDSFRLRNDDGSESAATWKAAVNTDITLTVSGDTVVRVRFLVKETAGNASTNFKPQLQRRLNAGVFADVTSITTIVKTLDSANLTDGEDTTQQVGAGTFIVNNDGVDDLSGSAGSANTDFVGNDETEFEYSVQIIDADVADTDTVDLRISDGDIDSYTVADATITISKGGTTFTENHAIIVASVAALTKAEIAVKSLAVAVSSTTDLVLQIGIIRAIVSSNSVALVKQVSVIRSIIASTTTAVVKQVSIIRAVAASAVAGFSKGLLFTETHAILVSGGAGRSQIITFVETRAIVVSSTLSLVKLIKKTLGMTMSSTATVVKQIATSIAIIVASVVAITDIRTAKITGFAVASAVVAMTKTMTEAATDSARKFVVAMLASIGNMINR